MNFAAVKTARGRGPVFEPPNSGESPPQTGKGITMSELHQALDDALEFFRGAYGNDPDLRDRADVRLLMQAFRDALEPGIEEREEDGDDY
jgi:hypothetical protein